VVSAARKQLCAKPKAGINQHFMLNYVKYANHDQRKNVSCLFSHLPKIANETQLRRKNAKNIT